MTRGLTEVNIDTLVGPTHTHGGLAYGNLASLESKLQPSNPQKAALEGLEKMKMLYDMGLVQLILPPHPRPALSMLNQLGFTSIKDAFEKSPDLLYQCSSSSAMWAANSATTAASKDCADKKVHITIANLAANFHRSLEAPCTLALFKKIFFDEKLFSVHEPLPGAYEFFDEGAANHTRFCDEIGQNGLHFFVYGRSCQTKSLPGRYPARQTREASECIARKHKLDPDRVVYAQQNPKVIDLGVFHNDVIATGHENFFLLHEDAYVDTDKVLDALQEKLPLSLFVVKRNVLSVKDAVRSYLFNSQIVRVGAKRIMICPMEVKKVPSAYAVSQKLLGTFVDDVRFIAINQSMKNGGGPACLRLRLTLNDKELKSIYPGVIFTEQLYSDIKTSILRYYPETFTIKDLLEPKTRSHITRAFEELYGLLNWNCEA